MFDLLFVDCILKFFQNSTNKLLIVNHYYFKTGLLATNSVMTWVLALLLLIYS